MVRRRRLLCNIRRRLCRRVCGDQFARRGICILRGRVCESVGSRLGVLATARARSRGDGKRIGECDPTGTGGVVCYARPRIHRAQDPVSSCPDWIHRRFYAKNRELVTCPGMGWWGWTTEGHAGNERAAEESRLSAFTVCSILFCPYRSTTTTPNSFISSL